jgi:hypothetical protein
MPSLAAKEMMIIAGNLYVLSCCSHEMQGLPVYRCQSMAAEINTFVLKQQLSARGLVLKQLIVDKLSGERIHQGSPMI